jgi:hypothetical protein
MANPASAMQSVSQGYHQPQILQGQPPSLFGRPVTSLWPLVGGAALALLVLGFGVWWFVEGRIPRDDQIAWATAANTNTVESYNRYVIEQPIGFYVSDAKDRMAEIRNHADDSAWADAATQNTAVAYLTYLQQYPSGRHVTEARNSQAEATKAEQILHVQQGLAMAGYYKGPADGKESAQTDAAIRSYQQAKTMPATGKIDDTLIAALDQDNAERLRLKREAAERENNAFNQAIASHDRAAYESFLRNFASSTHVNDIRQRLGTCHTVSRMENVVDEHDVMANGTGRGTGGEGCRLAQQEATASMSSKCSGRLSGIMVINENRDTTNAETGSSIISAIAGLVTKRNVNVNLPSTCTTDLRAHCMVERAVQRQADICG